MVRIGKKLKGFNKGLNVKDRENIKGDIKWGSEGETIEDKDKSIEKEQERLAFLPENFLDFREEKTIEDHTQDELDIYLKKNDIYKLLVLLLYKIIGEKPVNVCEFILNELKKILTEQEKQEKGEQEKGEQDKEIKEEIEKTNIFVKSSAYEEFLGTNHLTLDNLLDVLSFFKIENEDKIYFVNLKKIINIIDSSKNKTNFVKEKLNLSDTVPMNKAAQIVTAFYENYFYNKKLTI